jgi:hypothetical protein
MQAQLMQATQQNQALIANSDDVWSKKERADRQFWDHNRASFDHRGVVRNQ